MVIILQLPRMGMGLHRELVVLGATTPQMDPVVAQGGVLTETQRAIIHAVGDLMLELKEGY
jgi:hypothetical protein